MAEQLKGMRVAILLTDGFEESEFTEPKKALEQAGATVTVIAPKAGEHYSMKHHDKSTRYQADLSLRDARPDDFDAVQLPGGALNADAIRMEKKAQEFVKAMETNGKPIAVICHGPWLLVSAGLVKGKRMTSYHTIQDDLKNAGAKWEDAEVVREGNWVSSRKPDDLPAFNREMVGLFAEHLSKSRKAA